jgi:hypothetical protein
MASWTKKRKLLTGSLFLLGLLLLINPEIGKGIINVSAHAPDSAVYTNYCVLPSLPAKLNDYNNRTNRINYIDRRVDSNANAITYFADGNNFKQNYNLNTSSLFFICGNRLLQLQQTYHLLDIPPPSCHFI